MAKTSAAAKRKAVDSDEYLSHNTKKTRYTKSDKHGVQTVDEADASGNEDEEDDAPIRKTLWVANHLIAALHRKGTAKKARAELPPDEETFPTKFTARVKEKKHSLLALLDEKIEEITSQHHKASSDLVSHFQQTILAPTLRNQTVHHKATTTIALPSAAAPEKLTVASHPLYQLSLALFQKSHTILDDFNAIAKLFDSNKEKLQVGELWQTDTQRIVQALEAGKRLTIEEVKQRILGDGKGAKRQDEVDEAKIKERENDEILVKEVGKKEGIWESFCGEAGDAHGDVGKQDWAEVARKMEKRVERLTRCLPGEMDEEGQGD